jgi:hypothetical protein
MAQRDKNSWSDPAALLTRLLNKYAYLKDNGVTANRIYNLILKINKK